MPQYNRAKRQYIDRNNDLFDVVMLADEYGTIGSSGSRYGKDAWGRSKSVIDHSVFSATWTFGVPLRVWEEWSYNGSTWTPISGLNKVSQELKMLSVKSGIVNTNGTTVSSKIHPRYQPNRGHLYSTAIIAPAPNNIGTRRFGVGTPNDAVYFELVGTGSDWDILAVRRSYGTRKNYVSIKAAILENNPSFDPSKGHVYDIQYQWRGVGSYFLFVDLQLVHTLDIIGTLEELSISDPALPPFYSAYCNETGVEVKLLVGCVDITSEGGAHDRTLFGSTDTGDSLITLGTNVDTAVLALRVPRNVNGFYNSRGIMLDKLITWTRNESHTSVYHFRDTVAPALNSLTWDSISDSHIQKLTGGNLSALSTAFTADKTNGMRVLGEWADIDTKNVITNDSKNSPFNLTPGDILVCCVKCSNANVQTSATVYFSEEI